MHSFEKLYNISFSVHLLIHLAASVHNRGGGPLWATSTFPFESFNGIWLKFFNGTTHVSAQIVKRFLRWRGLSLSLKKKKKAGTIMANANDNIRKLSGKLQRRSGLTKKSKEFQDNMRGLG